jgi:hypothetical protein
MTGNFHSIGWRFNGKLVGILWHRWAKGAGWTPGPPELAALGRTPRWRRPSHPRLAESARLPTPGGATVTPRAKQCIPFTYKFTLVAPAVSNLALSGKTPKININKGAAVAGLPHSQVGPSMQAAAA